MASKKQDQKEMRTSFIKALYHVLSGAVSPTPYLEIAEGNNVNVRFLNGKGRLPAANTTEVTILDIDAASLFFDDFHVLYEGVTGVGKTYTSDALFNTVFGHDGHYPLRLSGGVLGSSALEPFTTTILENGVPKTKIDHEKCKKYGALFIDEINRGDPQEVFQVVDGKVHINGDTGCLGIPIPGTDKYKGLAIIAAMNPADAEHSAAVNLDIAGENRFLKFKFPNGVSEAGSSQLEKKANGDLHDRFWSEFGKRTGTSGGWRENYPVVADPEQFAGSLDDCTKEFIDISLGYVGYDPRQTCERNSELLTQAGIQPVFSVRDDNDYRKVLEAQGKLKHGFVRRDLGKISNLARLLAFIKGVKNGTYDTKAGLNDVTAAVGIVLESKTTTGTGYGALMTLVNDARTTYQALRSQPHLKIDGDTGIRNAVWQAAVYAGIEQGKDGFDAYRNTLRQGITRLNTQTSTPAQGAIISRLSADLVVADHFSQEHASDIKVALKEKGQGAFKALNQIYQENKGKSSIYEHRLNSLMG